MPRPLIQPPSTRRAVASLTLLAFVLASLGVLPSLAWIWARLPALTAYPCAGHACGCGSLENCWTSCRCLSRPERLAWTIRHRAPLPEFVRPTEAEWRLAGALAAGIKLEAPPGCPLCHTTSAEDDPAAGPSLSALGCQGAFPWITIPATPVEPSAFSLLIAGVPSSPAPGHGADRPDSRTLESPTPPPRAA